MKIYSAMPRPVISQGFGEANTAPSMLAYYQSIGLKGHDGIDFRVTCENYIVKVGGKCEPLYCDIDGSATITYISTDIGAGYGIVAADEDGEHKHLWWHFDSINPDLKVGSVISGGTLLGIAGNTGNTTGAHLHRGLYAYSEPYTNGYHGAVDPTPFFVPIFINDYITTLTQEIGILQKIINLFKQILGLK